MATDEIVVGIDQQGVNKLVERLGKVYQLRMQEELFSLYSKLVNDQLMVDDLELVGKRYGIDLESAYLDMVLANEDDDDSDCL